MSSPRPDAAALLRARRRTLRDVIAPSLRILFCGINPGLYSTAVGHHFGRPGNRFGRRCTPPVSPRASSRRARIPLLDLGLGITNLCPRTTASADELRARQLQRGGRELVANPALTARASWPSSASAPIASASPPRSGHRPLRT
jgi:TDG/mug DNA glycosylase family protein